MNILHICTEDSGGAGIAAVRFNTELIKQGIKSKILFLKKNKNSIGSYELINTRIGKNSLKINNILNHMKFRLFYPKRSYTLEIFTKTGGIKKLARHDLIKEADIVHLHWVANLVDYKTFFNENKSKKIIWTLHDMNPFTGGCHYSFNCKKYKKICNKCPQLFSKKKKDLSFETFKIKEKAYQNKNIFLVGPSKWIAKCASKSNLFKKFPIRQIYNGIPQNIFKKKSRSKFRKLLNLPKDKTILFYGADYMKNRRKGFKYLLKAIELLSKKMNTTNLLLVIFGKEAPKIDLKCKFLHIGSNIDEKKLALYYAVSDIFIIPSLADNLPNTILESMACGTPIVGFDVGGISEMIKNGETGLLAKPKSSKDFANKIKWMIKNPKKREKMGENARYLIEKEFSLNLQVKKYIKLYKETLRNQN